MYGLYVYVLGMKAKRIRKGIWKEKRVFFITPQILHNDLNLLQQLGSSIKCLVFDEAHKAKGNHAYCQVIRNIWSNGHKCFRVLALSATPGSNVNDVLEVRNVHYKSQNTFNMRKNHIWEILDA